MSEVTPPGDVHDAAKERRAAIVRKALTLRLNAIAARATVIELTDHRVFLLNSFIPETEREIARLRAEFGRRTVEHSPGTQFPDQRVAPLEERLQLLKDVVLPDLEHRLAAAQEASQSAGLAAERLLRAAANEIQFLGIANAF